jgi:aquaporin Z
MQQKLIAEAFGTFTLALAVLTSLHMGADGIIPTPVVAALTLALFVYTIGPKSGCHINPAVTLGLWSLNKVKTNEAIKYIVAQIIGGFLAFALATAILGAKKLGVTPESVPDFLAEALGAIIFGFGIAAVVHGKVKDDIIGLVIGGSLLLGIILAAGFGSMGILNPAVALALGAINFSYMLGSIVGMMLGMNLYRKLIG